MMLASLLRNSRIGALTLLLGPFLFFIGGAAAQAPISMTPYQTPKVVVEFYYDDPSKLYTGLYWLRSLINPLMESPYDIDPSLMDIVVVIHGTEIVTLAQKNYERYEETVERMRYYANLGVKFKACALAAKDYGYTAEDLYSFVELVPSAMPEIVHWQNQGYALLLPQVFSKKYEIDEIR